MHVSILLELCQGCWWCSMWQFCSITTSACRRLSWIQNDDCHLAFCARANCHWPRHARCVTPIIGLRLDITACAVVSINGRLSNIFQLRNSWQDITFVKKISVICLRRHEIYLRCPFPDVIFCYPAALLTFLCWVFFIVLIAVVAQNSVHSCVFALTFFFLFLSFSSILPFRWMYIYIHSHALSEWMHRVLKLLTVSARRILPHGDIARTTVKHVTESRSAVWE
jgi:hypothetical protein